MNLLFLTYGCFEILMLKHSLERINHPTTVCVGATVEDMSKHSTGIEVREGVQHINVERREEYSMMVKFGCASLLERNQIQSFLRN